MDLLENQHAVEIGIQKCNDLLATDGQQEAVSNVLLNLISAFQKYTNTHLHNNERNEYPASEEEGLTYERLREKLERLQVDVHKYLNPRSSAPSQKSGSSIASAASSRRIETATHKAKLYAEAHMLKERQELDRQVYELKQRQDKLDLDTKIAIAEAEIQALEAIENEENKRVLQGDEENDECLDGENEQDLDDEVSIHPRYHKQEPKGQYHNSNVFPTVPNQQNRLIDALDVPKFKVPQQQYKQAYKKHSSMPSVFQPPEDCQSDLLHQQRQLIDMLNAPKIEIPSFDGNPLKYHAFICAFQENVERVVKDGSSRLMRLAQHCTGKAGALVESCLVMNCKIGYSEARKLLKERFGDPFVIAHAWIDKVTSNNCIKDDDFQAIQDLADELRVCHITLEAIGAMGEANTQTNLQKIIQRLPGNLQTRWCREVQSIKRSGRLPRLTDIAMFVKTVATELSDPVYGPKQGQLSKASTKQAATFHTSAQYNEESSFNQKNKGAFCVMSYTSCTCVKPLRARAWRNALKLLKRQDCASIVSVISTV